MTAAEQPEGYIMTDKDSVALSYAHATRDWDLFDRVVEKIHTHPHTPQEPLAKENLTVGMVAAYEAGVKDGAKRERERVLAPLKAVYGKFDHLDKCLSDTEWCEAGETSAIYGIAGELWRAIKESLRGKP